MIKKILIITGLCLLGGYLIFAAFFFEKQPQEKVCSHFEVVVDNKSDDKFIEASDIEKDINAKGLNPYGKQLKEVDTYAIQQEILENKLIRSANVFVTSDGGIRAVIQERIPVLRIIPDEGDSYYIDKSGESMPLSNRNTAYLPLATGNIKEDFAATDLYKFALYLYDNAFWNAQIEQIVVKSKTDISLITRIGDQEILLGSLDNYEDKLARLKTFYTKALPNTGWNRYSKLNLKYDKQVIGTKR